MRATSSRSGAEPKSGTEKSNDRRFDGGGATALCVGGSSRGAVAFCGGAGAMFGDDGAMLGGGAVGGAVCARACTANKTTIAPTATGAAQRPMRTKQAGADIMTRKCKPVYGAIAARPASSHAYCGKAIAYLLRPNRAAKDLRCEQG